MMSIINSWLLFAMIIPVAVAKIKPIKLSDSPRYRESPSQNENGPLVSVIMTVRD